MTFQIADTLYYNGFIYTADHHDNIVDAIAINQGVIIATGKKECLLSYCNDKTELIDLQGKWLCLALLMHICTHFGVVQH